LIVIIENINIPVLNINKINNNSENLLQGGKIAARGAKAPLDIMSN